MDEARRCEPELEAEVSPAVAKAVVAEAWRSMEAKPPASPDDDRAVSQAESSPDRLAEKGRNAS